MVEGWEAQGESEAGCGGGKADSGVNIRSSGQAWAGGGISAATAANERATPPSTEASVCSPPPC
jgi:hypothetical protein